MINIALETLTRNSILFQPTRLKNGVRMCGCESYGGCGGYGDEDACGFRKIIPTSAPTTEPTPDPTFILTTNPSLFPTKAANPTRHSTIKPSFKSTKRPSKRSTVPPSPHRRTKAPKTDKPTRKNKG